MGVFNLQDFLKLLIPPGHKRYYDEGLDVSRLDISPVVCPNCYEARYGSIRFLCLSQACALIRLAKPIPILKGEVAQA